MSCVAGPFLVLQWRWGTLLGRLALVVVVPKDTRQAKGTTIDTGQVPRVDEEPHLHMNTAEVGEIVDDFQLVRGELLQA
jgi:hypothetical protein